MKRALLTATALLMLVPLVWAQTTCPQQVYKDPTTCPATLDMARIPTDPNTNKPALLNWVFTTVGKTWSYSGTYRDCNGDAMVLTASTGTLTAAGGNYTITGSAGTTAGILYVKIIVTEQLDAAKLSAGQTPASRLGVLVVIILPRNDIPILTDAGPIVPNWDVWPYPQQRAVMAEYKRTGMLWRNTGT